MRRIRLHIPLIDEWEELISVMDIRFMPENYKQELFKRVYTLKQGKKSIGEYRNEFELVRIRANFEEEDNYGDPIHCET